MAAAKLSEEATERVKPPALLRVLNRLPESMVATRRPLWLPAQVLPVRERASAPKVRADLVEEEAPARQQLAQDRLQVHAPVAANAGGVAYAPQTATVKVRPTKN